MTPPFWTPSHVKRRLLTSKLNAEGNVGCEESLLAGAQGVILEAKPFYLGTALKRANRAFARGMCMPQTMGTVKEAAAKGDEAKMGRQS